MLRETLQRVAQDVEEKRMQHSLADATVLYAIRRTHVLHWISQWEQFPFHRYGTRARIEEKQLKGTVQKGRRELQLLPVVG